MLLSDLDGQPIDPAGKVLLVNYWAEWCKPCREEIPELNQIARGAHDVVVVGVNFDLPEPRENRAQAQKMGIEFPQLAAEPIERWGRQRPAVLPTTFVIGADGRWRETLYGPQTVEKLVAAVKRSRL
jgi:thiol-disulfide isomerase/thioredoxin